MLKINFGSVARTLCPRPIIPEQENLRREYEAAQVMQRNGTLPTGPKMEGESSSQFLARVFAESEAPKPKSSPRILEVMVALKASIRGEKPPLLENSLTRMGLQDGFFILRLESGEVFKVKVEKFDP